MAIVFGAGTMTLTLYSLHVVMRTEYVLPEETPSAFPWHVVALTGDRRALRLRPEAGPTRVVGGELVRPRDESGARRELGRRLGSTLVTSPKPLLVAAALGLALAVSACTADPPAGTIAEGDLPGEPEVAKVRTNDDQAGQVVCQAVNDAEDNHLMTPSENYDRDLRATVSYDLAGTNHETVSDSVWRISDPRRPSPRSRPVSGVRRGAAGALRELHRRRTSRGPGVHRDGRRRRHVTRRILVPLSDRVVIVTTDRQGGNDFTVQPEDILEKALEVSADAPQE